MYMKYKMLMPTGLIPCLLMPWLFFIIAKSSAALINATASVESQNGQITIALKGMITEVRDIICM